MNSDKGFFIKNNHILSFGVLIKTPNLLGEFSPSRRGGDKGPRVKECDGSRV